MQFGSPTDALSITIAIDGFYLFDNVKVIGSTGEYLPIDQNVDRAEFSIDLVANSSNVLTILLRQNSVTVDEDCVRNVSYTWGTERQIEIVQSGN